MFPVLEAAFIAASLSIDAFAAGFAYGSKKISVPFFSAVVINLICCITIGVALFAGHLLKPVLPEGLATWVAFVVLFLIGLIKLLDGVVKSLIRKYTLDKAFRFSIFDVKFILRLYANPEAADSDVSSHLSVGEAAVLAVSLSLDGMAVGFAAALAGVNAWILIVFSLIANMLAIVLGRRLGFCLSKTGLNLSWVAGLVLICLAFWRL